MSGRPGRIELPPDPRADKKLRKLADDLGFNSANLRGIGTSSTLVLLNGRRMANFASPGDDTGVDLNNIPAAAIARGRRVGGVDVHQPHPPSFSRSGEGGALARRGASGKCATFTNRLCRPR